MGDLFSGLFDFLGSMLQSIFDFFKPLIDFIAWLLEFLSDLVSALGNFIWSLFEGAINLIVGGIEKIVDWIGSFFKFLGDLFHDLFVPSDDYFSSETGKLQKQIEGKVGTEEYTNALNSLTRASKSGLQDIKVNLWGITVTLVPFSLITPYIATIQNWTRGFMFSFIILWQINNVYKLIRGTSLINFSGNKGSDEKC